MIVLAAFVLLAQVTGTVTDAVTHQAVRGAHVKAAGNEDSVTGEDGGYSIGHPGAGEVPIRAEAKGYRALQTKAQVSEGGYVRLDLELHPMGRIKGTIVDKDTGEPVAGFLLLRGNGGAVTGDMAALRNGAFEMEGLEPGDYTLSLLPMSDPRAANEPRKAYGDTGYPVHVAEGQQQVLDIRLPAVPAYHVAGTIEIPAGRESESLTIGVHRIELNSTSSSDRKQAGPFAIGGLTPGAYTFTGKLGRGVNALYGELSLSITDHDIDEVRLELLPTASVTATIHMTEDGVDVPEDAELSLFEAGGKKAGDPVSLHDGRFRIEGIPPGRYWPQLSHLPAGYAQTMSQVALYGPVEVPLVVTSKPGAIVGVVRDENQAPMVGATVVLVPDSGLSKSARSGTAGAFRFPDVAPGKYNVNGVAVEVGPGQTVAVEVHRVKT